MSIQGVIADTHAIIWYVDSPSDLSPAATMALDNAADDEAQRIFLSAISLIEMQYLTEKGKLNPSVLPKVMTELDDPQPIIEVVQVDRIVANHLAAIPRTTVPDLPDRMIAASALMLNLPLVTADAKIRASSNVITVW